MANFGERKRGPAAMPGLGGNSAEWWLHFGPDNVGDSDHLGADSKPRIPPAKDSVVHTASSVLRIRSGKSKT